MSTASSSPARTSRGTRAPDGGAPTFPPAPLETSMAGVFAVGDVRYRSVKRVASAFGEGSAAIQQVHEHLSRSDDAGA